MKVGILLKAV